jgi:DNA topoisomerase-1
MATVVALLDRTLLRVGNSRHLRENRSFGLTTLEDRHVDIRRDQLGLHVGGKGCVEHHIAVSERRLTQIVRRCRDLPGQPLFQYLDDDGNPHPVSSDDVNAYLKTHGRGDFSAKDYRTWAGSVLALGERAPNDRLGTGGRHAGCSSQDVIRVIAFIVWPRSPP